MAKKTTTRKTTSRRKKTPEVVEDAQIVDEAAQSSPDDTVEAAVSDDVTEAAEDSAPEMDGETGETTETPEEGSQEPSEEAPSEALSEAPAETPSETPAETQNETPVETQAETRAEPTGQNGGGAMALIFGGVIAGAIGFGASYFSGGSNTAPAPEPVDLSAIEQAIEAQTGRLDDLAASIPEAQAPADLSGVEAQIADLAAAVSDLEARITALEGREPATAGAVDPALRDDLEALKSTIAALESENEAAKASAQAAAADTLKRAAMTQVETALDTGAPFADVISDLTGLGVEVPAALAEAAANGVPTLAGLQESFPEAARAALSADREAAAESGETGGLTGFIKSQLGARSLTPQEGDGTDAVLSRVEAALRAGQLAHALTELETLPEVAQPAMADWTALAAGRDGVLAAAKMLSDSLN